MTVFWFLLYAQKERLRGERCLLCLCKRLRDADRRNEMITLIFAVNPSVSLAADSSPYTGEPVGWGDGWLVVGISHNCYNIIQKRYVEKKIFLCNSQLNVTCAKSIIFIYILHKG